jgi:putative NADH-flavin reductase
MNIALFGATGGTGHQVLIQALERGHHVKALARDPSKLPAGQDRLTPIPGDILDQSAVDACVQGTDAVVCLLGTRSGAKPIEALGTRTIVKAMQDQGVRRLIAVTSLGVGDSKDQIPFFFKVLMQLGLKKIMAAKEEQERTIEESGLDWTIVRPGGLTDGPRTGNYVSGLDKAIMARRVSRADVAEFVLRQLGDDRYLRQTPAIT